MQDLLIYTSGGPKMEHSKTNAATQAQSTSYGDHEEEEIQDFLKRFAQALTSADIDTILSLWGTPAFVLSDNTVRTISSPKEIERFFAGAKDQYTAHGISSTRPEILRLEWLTRRLALVTVRWPYLNGEGKESGEVSSTYVLRYDNQGHIKLHVALMQGLPDPH